MSNATPFAETRERFADAMARICGIYGVNPLIGRLYGILFLSTEPLSLDALADRAGAAKSTTSVAARKLVDVRVARRSWRRGDRRDWFEAVTDPATIVRELRRAWFDPEIATWREALDDARRALADPTARDGDGPGEDARRELLRRAEDMRAFVEASARLLDALDPPPAREPARPIAIEIDR